MFFHYYFSILLGLFFFLHIYPQNYVALNVDNDLYFGTDRYYSSGIFFEFGSLKKVSSTFQSNGWIEVTSHSNSWIEMVQHSKGWFALVFICALFRIPVTLRAVWTFLLITSTILGILIWNLDSNITAIGSIFVSNKILPLILSMCTIQPNNRIG